MTRRFIFGVCIPYNMESSAYSLTTLRHAGHKKWFYDRQQGSGWDGTKKSSHGTKCFVPSHPMGFPKKKSHPIPSHGIDNSSHPIPWVPWDERNIKRLLKTWINFHDFLIQSSQFPPICSQLDLFIWHLFFILTTNPIELLNNRLRSYWC